MIYELNLISSNDKLHGAVVFLPFIPSVGTTLTVNGRASRVARIDVSVLTSNQLSSAQPDSFSIALTLETL